MKSKIVNKINTAKIESHNILLFLIIKIFYPKMPVNACARNAVSEEPIAFPAITKPTPTRPT